MKAMLDEITQLKRRLRQLESSRQKWKCRSAAKQQHIRYLRVQARDLERSRDHWRQRAAQVRLPPASTPPLPPPALLALPVLPGGPLPGEI